MFLVWIKNEKAENGSRRDQVMGTNPLTPHDALKDHFNP